MPNSKAMQCRDRINQPHIKDDPAAIMQEALDAARYDAQSFQLDLPSQNFEPILILNFPDNTEVHLEFTRMKLLTIKI